MAVIRSLIRHNDLLCHVVEQSLQSLLDALLIIQRASQQMSFELLINERNSSETHTHSGILVVGGTASVEIFLTFLSLDDRIAEADDFIDKMVNHVERVHLEVIANGNDRNIHGL